MGTGRETASVWVVIASVGVVALAGLALRVDRVESPRERAVARRLERERNADRLREMLRLVERQHRARMSPLEELEREPAEPSSGTLPIAEAAAR